MTSFHFQWVHRVLHPHCIEGVLPNSQPPTLTNGVHGPRLQGARFLCYHTARTSPAHQESTPTSILQNLEGESINPEPLLLHFSVASQFPYRSRSSDPPRRVGDSDFTFADCNFHSRNRGLVETCRSSLYCDSDGAFFPPCWILRGSGFSC